MMRGVKRREERVTRAGEEIEGEVGRRAQASFSLQVIEAQDSCGSCYVLCHVSDCTLLRRRHTPIILSESVYLSLFS